MAALTIDELVEEFDFLGTWEEQCKYLIELGEELPDLDPSEKIEANRVHGCQSQVWFVPDVRYNGAPRLTIRAKSDARIVDGLIVALLALTNGKSPAEILATDYEQQFARLGLQAHLVPQRRNGLFSMVERVRAIARALAETTETPAASRQDDDQAPSRPEPRNLPVTSTDDDRKHEPLDVDAVRAQFPALHQKLEGDLPVTFLDSASSAQKPQCVIDKEREVYEQYYANAYRGVYRFGDRISRELEESRERIRRFIGAASTDEVIFTSGTTMGINLVANAWGRRHLKPGDEIVLNEVEHHANLVPWQWIAEQTGAVLKFIPLTDDLRLDLDRLDEVLTGKTRIVAVTGMSNVLGTVPPLTELIPRAKAMGALVLVDGAQSVPHMPSHVVEDGIDFLAFSGHKLYGPTGVGVLYGRRELLESMDPFLCGGHMIDQVEKTSFSLAALPARFEAGTLPIAQAIALGRAVQFVEDLGFCPIHHHEQSVLRYAWERMHDVPGIRIFGPDTSHRGAIVSFTIDGAAAGDIASLLDLKGVFVRHGHHCTMPLHERLGVPATVRASFGLYNTRQDVDTLIKAIDFARRELKLG
jgi:cysteine desulfurase / selenocysteine lyase